MNNIHPNTLLFFEKLKTIFYECQQKGEVTISRLAKDCDDEDKDEYYWPYSSEGGREFNENFNYYHSYNYKKSPEITSFIRYHVMAKPSQQSDMSTQFIDDLIYAFINPNIGF